MNMKLDPWHYGTWEGTRDGVREENLKLSLSEKIQILEDMEQLAVRIHRQRLREGLPVDPKVAPLLNYTAAEVIVVSNVTVPLFASP